MYASRFRTAQAARYQRALKCTRDELIASVPSFGLLKNLGDDSPFARYLHLYGFCELIADLSRDSKNTTQFEAGFIPCDSSVKKDECLFAVRLSQADSRQSKRRVALLSHGLFDHCGLYLALIKTLYLQGYDVIAFDYHGYGLSSGEATHCDSFNDYLNDLMRVEETLNGRPADVYAGQSTGCAIISLMLDKRAQNMCANASAEKKSKAVILLAPLAYPRGLRSIRLSYFFLSPFIHWFPRTFRCNSSKLSFVEFIKSRDPLQSLAIRLSWIRALFQWRKDIEKLKPNLCNALIFLGDKDGTIDQAAVRRCYARLYPQAVWSTVVGGGHHLVNERDELYMSIDRQIGEFLQQ